MANWTRLKSPQFSDNEDTYETEPDNIGSDEPINLKQVNHCDPNHNQEDSSYDWDTSKLLKAKAFRIKDILGLEENEKLANVPPKSNQNGHFVTLNKTSSTLSSNTTQCMFLYQIFFVFLSFFLPKSIWLILKL